MIEIHMEDKPDLNVRECSSCHLERYRREVKFCLECNAYICVYCAYGKCKIDENGIHYFARQNE